jgi:hypothetical protein
MISDRTSLPDSDYVVTWGSPEGYSELMVRATLADGGNPARPEDWQTSMFEPKD